MNNQHPITPPPELMQQWMIEATEPFYVPTQAARWGAAQELEACAEWLQDPHETAKLLRAARRPKPPSLKEQALKALHTSVDLDDFPKQYDTIRRALEALPE